MKHNHAACQERLLDERMFYRKDHLQQHLKLIHDAQFMKWPMEQWKYEIQEIRSRCGFCGLVLSTWADRVDHLAEHFKDGKTIADWQGDWGFEGPVLDMVENSMPPYLINYERNSPWPFTTHQGPPESPTSAFELIQVELEYFAVNYFNAKHCRPSDQELQYEACCVIFGSDMLSQDPATPSPSWLRDLFMSSEEITKQARIRHMKSAAKSRITHLKIHGKDNIFEACNMEAQLHGYADTSKLLDLNVGDDELQREACSIVKCMEALSPDPSGTFVRLLTGLIYGSTLWLAPFRQRADLAPAECPRVARELSRFVASTVSARNPNSHVPTDEELQHQARWIMFDDDDPWNQTPADNADWLREFKRGVGLLHDDTVPGMKGGPIDRGEEKGSSDVFRSRQ
ncbi:hypothetical protein BGZ63DRAFT_351527 [Neofusicoccum parvum]|uniref:Uncharacterized protein n=1 Tax=Neofusicoccum parvum TaxID=310453 RepID=A0ACB5SM00_9PEZI|nr:hypothetical protein BGZ63DRAFT_351527 [Neofusicoccum parvum]